MRAGAALNSAKIADLAYGAKVTDTGRRKFVDNRQRAHVRLPSGTEGWISARLMRLDN
mgnify:CR=1 FL=1